MKNIRGLHISYYINFFGAVVLLVLAVLMLSEDKPSIPLIADVMIISLSMFAILYFGVRCIISAVVLYRRNDLLTLRKFMKIAKNGLILFFIINFVYYFLFIMILMAASRGIFLFGPIPMILIPLVIFTYFAVIFTSSFSIAFVLLMKKKERFDTSTTIFHICLQLTFVLDIIGMFYLLRRFKKDDVLFAVVES